MRTQRLNLNSNKGLSLIEVMIALAVMGGLLLGVYQIVDSSTQNAAKFMIEDEDKFAIETALERIRLDFSQIYTPLFFQSKSKSKSNRSASFTATENFPRQTRFGEIIPNIESDEPTEITFFMNGNRRKIADSKQSTFGWVRYSLRPYKPKGEIENLHPSLKPREGAQFELTRQIVADDPYRPEISWDEVKKHVLLKHISEFKIEYWDAKRRKFITSYRSLGERTKLLRSIRMTLKTIDYNGAEETTQRIFRSIWPAFDTKADDKARDKESSSEKKTTTK